jgi:penicillin amidase
VSTLSFALGSGADGMGGFPESDEYDVDGLEDDVEIVVDKWGVPHIYAQSKNDLFLAQGFNAARDRLYQIDLWRRRGHGKLASVFGRSYIEQDRASRLFLYRGDIQTEWLAYGPETKAIVSAFTTGVNAYVRWVREDPARLPPEFRLYNYGPDLWKPEDVILLRTHGLFYNVEQEIARAQTLRDFGADAEELRQAREPHDALVVPEGLDLDLLADDVMSVYRLAFAPVNFAGQTTPSDWHESISGSNNWVVSGELTETGRPILANDPHRAVTLPSLRYMAHLDAPGVSVIGAGEPGLPGISIGHNGKIAFGLTIWPADQEDLYVYELSPDDATKYRYGDGWESFRTITETVEVAGAASESVTLDFTRHGPVIHTDAARGFAVAVRAVWLEPGMAPYLASTSYFAAEDGNGFVEALNRWGAPGVNQVFATPEGDIGWNASALIPRRPNWDGSLPVPGDGRYEWDGFVKAEGLPSVRRPEQGWIATANEMNLPDDFANDELTITYDWYSYARFERLSAWLCSDAPTGIDASVQMQSDSLSVHALRLCRLLDPIDTNSVGEGIVLDLLRTWDGDETTESFEALIFEVWIRRHLRPWLIEDYLSRRGLSAETIEASKRLLLRDESFGGDLRGDIRMLGDFDTTSMDRLTTLTEGVDSTLTSAVAEIEGILGTDRAIWSWGAVHHALFVHPALDGLDDVPSEWARLGPSPRPGSGDTVGNAGYDANFRQTVGSTFRMVIDVGEWDSSRAMNAPGQSGDPRSPHYSDLFDPWVTGGSFPLVYSREAVETHAESRILLRARGAR